MPKQLWTNDAEKALMDLWGELVSSAQGKMMTRQEKLDTVQGRLNEKSAAENWQIEFTSEQTSNKLDTLTKKAKKTYDKFKKFTWTGSAVPDKYDLEVCALYKDCSWRMRNGLVAQCACVRVCVLANWKKTLRERGGREMERWERDRGIGCCVYLVCYSGSLQGVG